MESTSSEILLVLTAVCLGLALSRFISPGGQLTWRDRGMIAMAFLAICPMMVGHTVFVQQFSPEVTLLERIVCGLIGPGICLALFALFLLFKWALRLTRYCESGWKTCA